MIEQMKKYTFLVFHRDYEPFLTELRELGVVHITQKAEGQADDEQLEAALLRKQEILKILRQGAPDQLLQERKAVEERIQVTQKEVERMRVWGEFSAERIRQLADAGYQLLYYTCPSNKFEDAFGTIIAEQGKTVYFVCVSHDEEVNLPDYCVRETLNEKSYIDLQKDVEGLRGLLVAADGRIEAWQKGHVEELKAELEELRHQIDWKRVNLSTDTLAEGSLKLLEGFCPQAQCEALNAILDKEDVYYEVEEPVEGDVTPIKLNNNRFSKLFEVFTGMYGWPTYGEFDPTPILAPFYLLFFSMCMGDAGYGILLMLFGWLTYKGKLKIEMFEGLGPIIMTLGVGTLVVGFFLGTFFGMSLMDATWFPESLKKVLIVGKVQGYDIQMVLALCIGVFHICLAMVVKALCYTKRFGFRAQLGTWGWTLLIVGGIAAFIICMALSVPSVITKWVLIIIAAISALGIFVFNTPGRNPLLNIGAGLWDTYNMATGILGDTLSYIRLYALGLAGGMLGGAFNNLGLMVMGGSTEGATWQWIPFILILIVGHLLNLAMSALGAFVHPLRLTFVEYFKNSGYEGKGNLYTPFKK